MMSPFVGHLSNAYTIHLFSDSLLRIPKFFFLVLHPKSLTNWRHSRNRTWFFSSAREKAVIKQTSVEMVKSSSSVPHVANRVVCNFVLQEWPSATLTVGAPERRQLWSLCSAEALNQISRENVVRLESWILLPIALPPVFKFVTDLSIFWVI